jgi:DNA processing protein
LRALGLPAAAVRWLAAPDEALLAADARWLAASGTRLLCRGDADFPPQLRTIPDAPLTLFIQGDPALLSAAQIALVGTRKPSRSGLQQAQHFASCLTAAGLVITSGLALGIDRVCHETALARGRTVAVLGAGLDRLYPPEHGALAQRIIAGGGALVSEFPPGVPPLPEHFPRRNRLISGLARAVVVIEAARRSGSLITARLAAEQSRGVFAVPGSVANPMAAGCHWLIRQGATLAATPFEVLDDLQIPYEKQGVMFRRAEGPRRQVLDKTAKILLDAIGFEPISSDFLVASTGLDPAMLTAQLLLLELEGLVGVQPGGRYVRLDQASLRDHGQHRI